MPDDPRFEIKNDAVKATMRDIAGSIGGALPEGWGFTLLLFQYGEGGGLFHISSAERADNFRMIREWMAKVEKEGGA